jgi:hypothetical protein
VLLLGAGALIPVAEASGDLSFLVGGIAAVAAVGVLFAVPVSVLPVLTLLVTLLVPAQSTLLPKAVAGAAFGVIPLGVWILRARPRLHVPFVPRVLALLFGAWLVLSEALAPLHTNRGWQWFITAAVAVVFAVVRTPGGLKPPQFRTLFLAIATLLGAYALLEAIVLHDNVLFGPLLEHTTWWASIHRGTSYRVTTLLGHPLINGTVFSAAAVLAASDVLQNRQRTTFAFARLAILVGAVLATQSRGAAIALAAGAIVLIVFTPGRKEGLGARRLALILGSITAAAVIFAGLQGRNESTEGRSSAATRLVVITRAAQTLHGLEPFGAGPGESDAYREANQLPESQTALENSYAQLAVSLGPIGALLMLTLLITVVLLGIRSGHVTGEAAALLTILVGMAGYNAIEGDTPLLVLIALFVISVITGARSAVPPDLPRRTPLGPTHAPT